MKKVIWYFLFLFALMPLSSCSELEDLFNDEDDEEEFEIESKIRKLEGMKAHKKEKDERMKKEKDLTKGKRLVGGLNKLSKVNIR